MSSDLDPTDARELITAEQCRSARKLLRLSAEALARRANARPETVASFESGRPSTFPMRARLRAALEAAGVVFTNGDEPGVQLRGRKG